EKTALLGGFFVSRARDYDATERISRGSYSIPLPPKGKPAPLHDTSSLKKIIEPLDFNNKKNRYNHDPQSPNLGNKINDL
ncbi:hypothetical protein P0173_26460, partial [Klebsiella pneumoniae]